MDVLGIGGPQVLLNTSAPFAPQLHEAQQMFCVADDYCNGKPVRTASGTAFNVSDHSAVAMDCCTPLAAGSPTCFPNSVAGGDHDAGVGGDTGAGDDGAGDAGRGGAGNGGGGGANLAGDSGALQEHDRERNGRACLPLFAPIWHHLMTAAPKEADQSSDGYPNNNSNGCKCLAFP